MSFYSVALFLHIVGAITLFMAFAIEWTGLLHLQRASKLEQARLWVNASSVVRPLSIAGMIVLILAGGYLTHRMEAWRYAWLWVALAATFSLAGIAATLTQRRMKEIRRACHERRELTEGLTTRFRDPVLQVSIRLRTAFALGIVFVMTTKPNLIGSLLALAVATFVAVLPNLLARTRHRRVDVSIGESY